MYVRYEAIEGDYAFFFRPEKTYVTQTHFFKKNFADDILRDFFAMGGMFQMYRSHTIQRLLSTKNKLLAFNSNL